MDVSWIQHAREAFSHVYPGGKALEICAAVMPGIIGDFRAAVLQKEDGAVVSEEYRTEDNRAVIFLVGHRETRDAGPVCVVTAMAINGAAVALGSGLIL